MATGAVVRTLLVLLAASLHPVWSVKQCYQSSCLPDNLMNCFSDHRASLSTCSIEDFHMTAQQLSVSYLAETDNVTDMVCVSFQAEGEMDHRVHGVVIRMCYPDQPQPCRSLEHYTRQHMVEYGIHNTSLKFTCSSCEADGCNSSNTLLHSTETLLAALALASTLHTLRAARE